MEPTEGLGPPSRADFIAAPAAVTVRERDALMRLARQDFVIARPSQLHPALAPRPDAVERTSRRSASSAMLAGLAVRFRTSAMAARQGASAVGQTAAALPPALWRAIRQGGAMLWAAAAAVLHALIQGTASLMATAHRLQDATVAWVDERRALRETGAAPERRSRWSDRIAAAVPERLSGTPHRLRDHVGSLVVLIAVPALVGIMFLLMRAGAQP